MKTATDIQAEILRRAIERSPDGEKKQQALEKLAKIEKVRAYDRVRR